MRRWSGARGGKAATVLTGLHRACRLRSRCPPPEPEVRRRTAATSAPHRLRPGRSCRPLEVSPRPAAAPASLKFGRRAGRHARQIAPEGGCPGNFFTSRKWTFGTSADYPRPQGTSRWARLSFLSGRFRGSRGERRGAVAGRARSRETALAGYPLPRDQSGMSSSLGGTRLTVGAATGAFRFRRHPPRPGPAAPKQARLAHHLRLGRCGGCGGLWRLRFRFVRVFRDQRAGAGRLSWPPSSLRSFHLLEPQPSTTGSVALRSARHPSAVNIGSVRRARAHIGDGLASRSHMAPGHAGCVLPGIRRR